MSAIKCPKCNGSGHCDLPKKMLPSLKLIQQEFDGQPFLVSEFQKAFNGSKAAEGKTLSLDHAQHRIKRYVKLGLLKRFGTKTPARYVAELD